MTECFMHEESEINVHSANLQNVSFIYKSKHYYYNYQRNLTVSVDTKRSIPLNKKHSPHSYLGRKDLSMKKDIIFLKSPASIDSFEFNSEVAEAFDDMITRSVPFYLEQQEMIKEIGKKFFIPGTKVYDLGCSTATTLINLCREIGQQACFIGYDSSLPMLKQANHKIKKHGLEDLIEVRYGNLDEEISKLNLDNASVVTMCWTLQFVRPLGRDNLIKWIYNSLVEEGILIVTEKILTNDSHMNRFFVDLYYDFKKRNGYTEMEIMRKREALENVLIPYRIDEDLGLFRRNGFEIVDTFFQFYNFAAFLCIKKTV